MSGDNVLYTLGYDAFGLPAEQHAIATGIHPRVNTEANIVNMRRQLRRLGLSHDRRRSVATTDEGYYHWTQWIFLQIFNAWYDVEADRARPIAELEAELAAGHAAAAGRALVVGSSARPSAATSSTATASPTWPTRPVNWCPGLGTILANEEVTVRGPLRHRQLPGLQAEHAPVDAAHHRLRRPAAGRPRPPRLARADQGHAAQLDRPLRGRQRALPLPRRPHRGLHHPARHAVRRDVHGAGARAPPGRRRSPTLDVQLRSRPTVRQAAVAQRAAAPGRGPGQDRRVPRARYATNPVTGTDIPIWIADYVLMGYGTGAIMAVPSGDQRDFEFARRFDLPIVATQLPPASWFEQHGIAVSTDCATWPEAYIGEGVFVNSANDDVVLDGDRTMAEAKRADQRLAGRDRLRRGDGHLQAARLAVLPPALLGRAVPDRLRRRRTGRSRVPESLLPVTLPDLDDFKPEALDPDDDATEPLPPLARAEAWLEVTLDLGDGPRRYRRELNVMPQWAGSCWYELRYLDPTNEDRLVDPDDRALLDGPPAEAPRPVASTSTSAASSTPCCTCSTPASGTRCSTTWASCPPRSRSTGCSTRATSRPTPTATGGARSWRPRTWSNATAAGGWARGRSSASTGRWARA